VGDRDRYRRERKGGVMVGHRRRVSRAVS
jgi:hypothetical protein